MSTPVSSSATGNPTWILALNLARLGPGPNAWEARHALVQGSVAGLWGGHPDTAGLSPRLASEARGKTPHIISHLGLPVFSFHDGDRLALEKQIIDRFAGAVTLRAVPATPTYFRAEVGGQSAGFVLPYAIDVAAPLVMARQALCLVRRESDGPGWGLLLTATLSAGSVGFPTGLLLAADRNQLDEHLAQNLALGLETWLQHEVDGLGAQRQVSDLAALKQAGSVVHVTIDVDPFGGQLVKPHLS